MPSNNERIPESLGYPETNKRNQNLQLGARILSLAHFESNHQPIVDSVFSKAIKKVRSFPVTIANVETMPTYLA